MPGMDLATLSIPDLRRVLDLARTRGQTDLADSVVAELRARAMAPAAGMMDDPPAMSFGPAPARFAAAGVGDGAWEDDGDPDLSPRRRTPMVILGIAAAVIVVGGLGLTAMQLRASDPPPAAPSASSAPAAAPALEAAAPVAEVETPAAPSAGRAVSPVETAAATPPPTPASVSTPVPVQTPEAAKVAAALAACRARPTPADRLVCGYPTLARQHERMLAAYNKALVMSGGDPVTLDADQARWRAARDRVSDREKLADLYQQRIRDLDAIAARPQPEPEAKPKPEQPIF